MMKGKANGWHIHHTQDCNTSVKGLSKLAVRQLVDMPAALKVGPAPEWVLYWAAVLISQMTRRTHQYGRIVEGDCIRSN